MVKSLAKLAPRLELMLFLGGVPLWVLFQESYLLRRGVLLAAGVYVVARLWNKVSWRRLFGKPQPGWWKWPLFRVVLAFALLAGFVLLFQPATFFDLPREHTGLWFAFVLLYPVLSVLPQELIYRVYIFETHTYLLNPPFAALLTSAIFFAWVHIVFAGWLAVVSSFAAGLALGWNYLQNRDAPGAIWPLALEHSLYGQIVFSIGLYQHFFLPR